MPRTPQFASTPRFVLSQRAPSSSFATRPRAESIGGDSPQNKPLAKRERACPAARDVIEDSEHESGLSDAEVDSEFQAEYEALFGETERSKAKRRRVDGQNKDENVINEDNRNDSDTDHCEHIPQINDNIINTNDDDNGDNDPTQEPTHPTEPPSSNEHIPSSPLKPPSTPYPNPHRRRFILGASSQLHTPSQSHSHTHSHLHPPSSATRHPIYTTPSQSIPPPPSSTIPPSSRRKPAFVLPRSPSPDTALDDVLSLFSPSRTQRRRGRPRTSAQGYVAGGMAEQVRGWVLEMGVKGGNSTSNPNSSRNGTGGEGQDGQRYAGVVRVCEAEGSAMGSCGGLVFVRGVEVNQERREDQGEDGGHGEKRNLLLMGAPRSPERDGVPELKKGDLVGIGRGLVWDVELDAVGESSEEVETWSVCVEWSVL